MFIPVVAGLYSRRAGAIEAWAAIGTGLAALAAVRLFAPAGAPPIVDGTLIGIVVSALAFTIVLALRNKQRKGTI